MTRFIHDQFAKDYLEELLKDYGKVKPSEKVLGIKEIDVLFSPSAQQTANLQVLGLHCQKLLIFDFPSVQHD